MLHDSKQVCRDSPTLYYAEQGVERELKALGPEGPRVQPQHLFVFDICTGVRPTPILNTVGISEECCLIAAE